MQSHFIHCVPGPFCCSSPASSRRGLLTCCLSSGWREKGLQWGVLGTSSAPARCEPCAMALLPWAPSSHDLSPVTNARPTYRVTFIQCKTRGPPGAGRQLRSSLWLMAFRFRTLSPSADAPFPPLLPLLPAASQGRRRRRRRLCREGSSPGSAPRTLLCSPLLTPWRCC